MTDAHASAIVATSALTKISFGVQIARYFMTIDKTMTARVALPLAGQTVMQFLADEKIEFGDPDYDWSAAAARDVARDYETDHWESAP